MRRARARAREIKGYFVLPADYMSDGHRRRLHAGHMTMSGSDARGAWGSAPAPGSGRVATRRCGARQPAKDARRFAVTRTGEINDGGQAARSCASRCRSSSPCCS